MIYTARILCKIGKSFFRFNQEMPFWVILPENIYGFWPGIKVDDQTYNRLLEKAEARDFDITKLVQTEQDCTN